MRIRVHHETVYRYAEPVFLEPHLFRLRPRADPTVAVRSCALSVRPGAGVRWHVDAEGNQVGSTWFDAPTAELGVDVEAEVETSLVDPFDFLLDDGAVELPIVLHPDEGRVVGPYRRRTARPDEDPVARLAAEVRDRSGIGTVVFLTALCREIHDRVRRVPRPTGAPRPAPWTLEIGEGACRDLAVLLTDAARSQGLAARFVSGWLAEPDPPEGHDLHAWTEVYLPGAGWRGLDPSRGIAVGERYVPLAVSASPPGAAPVTGTYRGKVVGTMETRLAIEVAS